MLLTLALSAALAADVDPYRPSGSFASGRGGPQTESPFVLGEGFGVGLISGFAQNPVRRQPTARPAARAVSGALRHDLYASWTASDRRARLELFAPFYSHVDAPGLGYRGPASGDLRAQLNVQLYRPTDAFALGLLTRVGLPTGSPAAGTARGTQTSFAVTAAFDAPSGLGLAANAGLTVAPPNRAFGIGTGSSVDLLAAGWWQAMRATRVGVEIDGRIGLVEEVGGRDHAASLTGFAQNMLPSGVGLLVGAGGRLGGAVGAPDFRVVAAISYQTFDRDRDRDGVVDRLDICPDEPEDRDGFFDEDGCLDPDNDGDGLLDGDDSCPDEPEDFDGFEDEDGCPDPDNDGDGVPDVDDRCPEVPGPADAGGCPDRDADAVADEEDACPDAAGPPRLSGCPDRDGDGLIDRLDLCPDTPGDASLQGCPDRDGDGVPDHRDACPDQALPPGADPARSDGCPRLAFLVEGRISITEKVNFETGRAKVAASSYALLREVADVMRANPGLRRIEVAGHTDNVGAEAFNLRLSQQRADAVRAHLVQTEGVPAERLVAVGYGEMRPITTNRTESGRARNRRVEFIVVEQDPIVENIGTQPLAPGADRVWDRPDTGTSDTGTSDTETTDTEPTGAAPAPPPRSPSAVVRRVGRTGEGATADPAGEPARLTIRFGEGATRAKVYVDNEPLPRLAPLDDYPVVAGERRVWIEDTASGIDHTETLTFHNGEGLILVLPIGAEPAKPTP